MSYLTNVAQRTITQTRTRLMLVLRSAAQQSTSFQSGRRGDGALGFRGLGFRYS